MSALVPEENKPSNEVPLNDLESPRQYTPLEKFYAELLGTFFLVFVGTGIAVFTGDLVASCVGGSLVLTSLIYVLGRYSGAHFNPAVSIPMFILGKLTVVEFLLYIAAQFAGAFVASIFVAICRKGKFDQLAGNKISDYLLSIDNSKEADFMCYFSAMFCEIVITFLLVLVVYSSGVKENNFGNLTGIVVGLTLGVLFFTGANISGGSLNPVRSIAPAVLQAVTGNDTTPLKQLWVYVLGPILGGIAGGFVGKAFGK